MLKPANALSRALTAAVLMVIANLATAEQLVYTTLAQPCRLIDTRTSQSGPGPLTAGHGPYTFGTTNSDIAAPTQNGNAGGCALPAGVAAVSVNLNQLDTTAAGNIRAWSTDAGTTGPSAGTAVYNPTSNFAAAGNVIYNGGSATIPLGQSNGRFYLAVSNGQIDLSMNVVGYWQAAALPTSYTFSLANADYAWNSNYIYDTGAGSYTEYFSRYHVVTIPAITQQILDGGSVQVYMNVDPSTNPNGWEPLNYRFDSSRGFDYVFTAVTSVGSVQINFFFDHMTNPSAVPTLSTYTIATHKFKVVITPSAISTSITP